MKYENMKHTTSFVFVFSEILRPNLESDKERQEVDNQLVFEILKAIAFIRQILR